MTALHKKINKLIKPQNYAVVLGENAELVLEMSKIFRTVFVYFDTKKNIKEKNVIYRNILENNEKISEVEAIILADLNLADQMKNLQFVFLKEKPTVIIYSGDLPKESICNWLANELGYRITHQEKKMYLWTREK